MSDRGEQERKAVDDRVRHIRDCPICRRGAYCDEDARLGRAAERARIAWMMAEER